MVLSQQNITEYGLNIVNVISRGNYKLSFLVVKFAKLNSFTLFQR